MRCGVIFTVLVGSLFFTAAPARADKRDPSLSKPPARPDWLVGEQHRSGYWEANQSQYRVAMTALVGKRHAVRKGPQQHAAGILRPISTSDSKIKAQTAGGSGGLPPGCRSANGLIGYKHDFHYTYGHGFSMLFLSQVYGEEENAQRRERLREVLTKAVQFAVKLKRPMAAGVTYRRKTATTSTKIHLRDPGAGPASLPQCGIPVPKEIIDKAVSYIANVRRRKAASRQLEERQRSRPPITAAANRLPLQLWRIPG